MIRKWGALLIGVLMLLGMMSPSPPLMAEQTAAVLEPSTVETERAILPAAEEDRQVELQVPSALLLGLLAGETALENRQVELCVPPALLIYLQTDADMSFSPLWNKAAETQKPAIREPEDE